MITRMHELRERDTACWISQLLSALEHMHGLQIAHCDVKPENVLLVSTGGGGLAATKLSDFGCARRVGVCAAPQGSRGYAAPEQRAGACVAACSVDLWGLGVLSVRTRPLEPRQCYPCHAPLPTAVSRGAARHRSTSCSRVPCPSSPPTTRAPASSPSTPQQRKSVCADSLRAKHVSCGADSWPSNYQAADSGAHSCYEHHYQLPDRRV